MSDRATVGNVEILAFVDATPPPFETTQFFPGVSQEQWVPYKKDYLTPEGKFQTNFGFFILRSRGNIVLVDTGLGAGPHERMGGIRGALMDKLKSAGIKPEDVNSVVITHLHGDHIGWNVTQVGGKPKATFPKAKYYIPRGDWEHFTKPDILANTPAVKTNAVPLQELGVMELVGDNAKITPELTTLFTPGHTPGHISLLISSQGQKGCIVGDLFHSAAQVTESNWLAGADMDKELARRTRNTVLERLEKEGCIVAAGHLLINKNIGKVVRLQGRRLWQVI